MQKNPFLCIKFLLGMNLYQNNAHNWLVFFLCVILVHTIEWPFARIESNIGQPFYAEKIHFYTKKFLLGMKLLQNNARNWLVFPSRVILVPTIEWPFACIKSDIGQPFYVEKSLFVQKISFRHEPFSNNAHSWLVSLSRVIWYLQLNDILRA